MSRSIHERAEDILAELPPEVAKTFKPKEVPAMRIAKEILHDPARRLHMHQCYSLGSGVHVCEDPLGEYAAMYYCSNWKGGKTTSGRSFYPHEEEAYMRRGCKKELKISYFDKSAYIDWISAGPERHGHGRAFWKDIRKFLERRKCIRRVTLQSLSEAEGFYECGIGFTPLVHSSKYSEYNWDGRWTKPNCQHGRKASRARPEDSYWLDKHEHLKPYEYLLSPKPGCEPVGPEPVQTRLSRYSERKRTSYT